MSAARGQTNILTGAQFHGLKHPWTYSCTFQSLPWHRRMLHYVGSGRLFADYEAKISNGNSTVGPNLVYADFAVNVVESLVTRLKNDSFATAMGEYWKTMVQYDNEPTTQGAYAASMLGLALDHTFPGHPDLFQMKKWPAWKLVSFIPKVSRVVTTIFNEASKEDAYNRIVQAYFDSEETGSEWRIRDVSLVNENMIDETPLLMDFINFAGELIGDGFSIPVHVPDEFKGSTNDMKIKITGLNCNPYEYENSMGSNT